MQGNDDVGAMLPQANEIDLAEDWKLLADYSPDNLFVRMRFAFFAHVFSF